MKIWQYVLLIVLVCVLLAFVIYKLPSQSPQIITTETIPVPEESGKKIPKKTELIFCSDPWVPYAGHAGESEEGYIVDVIRAIFEPLGYKVNYINTPWSRCIRDTRDGKFTALAGADFDEVPDFMFPKETIGTTRPAFFSLKDSKWTFNGIESLNEIRLGAIQDYTYSKDVDEYIHQYKLSDKVLQVKGGNPLERLIDSLEEGRIDTFIENAPVVYATVRKMGLNVEDFREAGEPKLGVRLFIAFSPKIYQSQQYADIFDKGVVGLRKSGQLKKILDRYGIKDWDVEGNNVTK